MDWRLIAGLAAAAAAVAGSKDMSAARCVKDRARALARTRAVLPDDWAYLEETCEAEATRYNASIQRGGPSAAGQAAYAKYIPANVAAQDMLQVEEIRERDRMYELKNQYEADLARKQLADAKQMKKDAEWADSQAGRQMLAKYGTTSVDEYREIYARNKGFESYAALKAGNAQYPTKKAAAKDGGIKIDPTFMAKYAKK